ncbi:MAG: DUF3107 domain-containing protein [Actinobacteria bacterium]|jgi:hypothetical protein|nr:DUF3107 domain-containing protein [Actinomycetota bacterium]NDA88687.1 DUF3107 domain-containing protein [Actinomycetota bacterium]
MATTKSAVKASGKTEVKIGISDSTHEIFIECSSSQSEVIAKVNDAIKTSSVLSLSDSKGREILVPHNKISYVEVGESADRRVGFANQ